MVRGPGGNPGSVRAAAAILALGALLASGRFASAATRAPEFDQYGGWTRLWVPPTGFFHIRMVRARPWIIDPLGNAFLWKGVSALPLQAEEEQTLRRLKKLGFNGVGPWTSLAPGRSDIAYMVALDVSRRAKEMGAGFAAGFPDVFDPAFERAVDEQARLKCAPAASDPWLVGYVTDADLPWRGAAGKAHGLVDDFFALPASSPGKAALVDELRKRYGGDVAAFNRNWGKNLPAFDALLDAISLEPGKGAVSERVPADRSALLSLIATRYFEVTYSAVRRYDPTHMVFGPRFLGPMPREVVMPMRGYAAAVYLKPDTSPPERLIKQIYRDTGMVTLLSEAAAREKQNWFEGYAAAASRIPYVIGYAWPALSSAEPLEANETAIVKSNAAFYREAARQQIWADARTRVPRYDLFKQTRSMKIDGSLDEWEKAAPMVLEVLPYEAESCPAQVTAFMMWDFGHVYLGGRVVDPRRTARTLTAYVADDAIEFMAAGERFIATLRPGGQVVKEVGRDKERPVRVAMQPIYRDNGQDITGYTFEAAVDVPVLLPVGFVGRFALVFHVTGEPREANTLCFPADVIADREKTHAEFVLAEAQ